MRASTQVRPEGKPADGPPADVLAWVRTRLAWERWLATARDRWSWEATRDQLENGQVSSTAVATSSSK